MLPALSVDQPRAERVQAENSKACRITGQTVLSPGFCQLVVRTQSNTHFLSVSDSDIYTALLNIVPGELEVKNRNIYNKIE
jgi:hypothetical protein